MADKTFDAVIVVGGTKALFLAMYLTKYGRMSVGILERRHEIGRCLATEEISAPGFRGNTHANIIMPVYYAPLYRDFPEFWEYGAQWQQYLCSDGACFADNDTCLAIYSITHDPSQEHTAREIARFSQKDADNWQAHHVELERERILSTRPRWSRPRGMCAVRESRPALRGIPAHGRALRSRAQSDCEGRRRRGERWRCRGR